MPQLNVAQESDATDVTLFDYSQLAPAVGASLQASAQRIRAISASSMLAIGRELSEVRDDVRGSPGGFHAWVMAEFEWSKRTAHNYIDVYRAFGDCANFAQLPIAKTAAYLLAASTTPDEVRAAAAAQAEAGERVSFEGVRAMLKPAPRLPDKDEPRAERLAEGDRLQESQPECREHRR